MSILMVLELEGATAEQYDRVNEILGIAGDTDAPDGLVSHVCGVTENGLLIADVWDSQEALGRFVEGRLQSAFAEAGLGDGTPRVLPVHNMIPQGAGHAANVIVMTEVEGFGPAEYDRMTSEMDAHVMDGSKHPCVSHVAAATDSGMLVVDLWESPEAFGAFAEREIAPAGEAIGLGPIEPRFVPVHNHIRGKAPVA